MLANNKPQFIKLKETSLATLAVACVAFLASATAEAKVYKWKNSNGEIVYQDRAPDSVQESGHDVLSRQGVVLEQVKSRSELAEAQKRSHEAELAQIRDRALLATFTTENDLIRTRDDRIGMIDGLISRLDDRIRILSERLAIVENRVRVQEDSSPNGRAHNNLYAEQRGIQRNIENAWSLIDQKAAERAEVASKFDADLTRYRELKSGEVSN